MLGALFLAYPSSMSAKTSGDYTVRNYYAVIVGIADYPGMINDLAYSDLDAIGVRDALLTYPQWQATNAVLLLNSSATKANIGAMIAQLGAKTSAEDVFFFFYSGHGSTMPDMMPFDELDFRDETLCAYDYEIRDDELSAWLGDINTNNVIVILDSCHSGGQIKSPAPAGLRAKVWPSTAGTVLDGDGFDADLKRGYRAKDMSTRPGCIIMTACRADQYSFESALAQHGLFSFFVIMAISDFLDGNGNGQLSAEEIGFSIVWSFWNMYTTYPRVYFLMPQFPQFYDDYPSGASATAELPVCWP